MKELMMNEDFSDVTLVTEDKRQIMANINILTTCSPVFKDILKKEKNSNQILYIRGVQFSELESIMQFIYLGEATFYVERMDEFLSVAKLLEIKELCNAETETKDEMYGEPSFDPVTSTEILEDLTVLDQKKMQGPQEKRMSVFSVNGSVNYACDKCDKQYIKKCDLLVHIKSKHEGIKYACDQCDYQATIKKCLTKHIQLKHEAIKYACDQCDYQAKRQDILTKHIQFKHEGITRTRRYACDLCEYQATLKSNLNRHVQSMHAGVKMLVHM